MTSTTPLLFFFDIDGTLVGDVSPLICMWEVAKRLNKAGLASVKKEAASILEGGLLRPGTGALIRTIRGKFRNSEIFVYTASDKKWAEFLVPCIEQVLDFKFNRPIFSRQNCISTSIDIRKSMKRILPNAVRTVKKNNPSCEKLMHHHFQERMVLIDNSPVLINDEMKKWIPCPTYAFRGNFDVLKLLTEKEIRDNKDALIRILKSFKLFPNSINSCTFQQFRIIYYQTLSKLITEDYMKINTQGVLNDSYFERLGRALVDTDVQDFRKLTVKRIKYLVSSR
jgi:hypothetical protein